MSATTTTIGDLSERYEAFIFDAFGVLVTHAGPLPGARELLHALKDAGKPFVVVTNDASRHPQTACDWYRSMGLPIELEQVLTSGALLTETLARGFPDGCRALVLGTADSERMAVEGGARLVHGEDDGPVDAVAVCDEAGYPLLERVELALNAVARGAERGDVPACFVANPDRVYPQGDGRLGIAAGSIAHLIEHAARTRFPELPSPLFTALGKPHPPIYEAAYARLGCERVLMVGDQLATDVKGALAVGLDAALVQTGVSRYVPGQGDVVPTWVLPNLE